LAAVDLLKQGGQEAVLLKRYLSSFLTLVHETQMVKHNNVIPNQHFHKKWAGGTGGSMRGPISVVTWYVAV